MTTVAFSLEGYFKHDTCSPHVAKVPRQQMAPFARRSLSSRENFGRCRHRPVRLHGGTARGCRAEPGPVGEGAIARKTWQGSSLSREFRDLARGRVSLFFKVPPQNGGFPFGVPLSRLLWGSTPPKTRHPFGTFIATPYTTTPARSSARTSTAAMSCGQPPRRSACGCQIPGGRGVGWVVGVGRGGGGIRLENEAGWACSHLRHSLGLNIQGPRSTNPRVIRIGIASNFGDMGVDQYSWPPNDHG